MKKQHIIGSLMVIILAGLLTPTIAAAVVSIDALGAPAQTTGSITIYGQPAIANADAYQQIEERILKATVRFYIETWVVRAGDAGYDIDYSSGHGTVKDGRFLVTHNHFNVPLSIRPRYGESELYTSLSLANSRGEILFKGPLSDFEVVWEDPETVVIAHKNDGFFEKLGFESAEFEEWSSVPLEAGMEVAQVDWDGTTTRVDWATVQEVSVQDGTPRLVLADDVTIGASGGGIFWQGVHIANNWRQVQQFDGSGTLINAVTTVALNSAEVGDGYAEAG
jgi:hypothetical protein